MEKLTATAILLAMLVFIGLRANTPPTVAAAFSQISDWPSSFWSAESSDNQIVTDTVPKPGSTQKITREDDNGKVEMEMKDGEITRLNVDGKEIPASEFNRYNELAEELQRNTPPIPMPPFPGMSPMPPMPAIAPMPPFPGMPPMPAIAPMPPQTSRLSTVTDGEGNVVIKLEKDGKPIEIKVKNGEVWMDGKKLVKGESVLLPGMGFGDAQPFIWNMDGHQFQFDGMGKNGAPNVNFSFSPEDLAEWEEHAAEMREEAKQYSDEYRALAEQHRNLSKEDKEKMEKELEAFHKDWEKEQEKWAKGQEKWALEQEKWALEQEKWQAENQNRNRNKRNYGGDFQQAMKAELLRENLISDPADYSFQLNSKSLKINGEKQSDEMHQKYLNMYERYTGNKMEKGGNYTVEQHD